MGTYIMNKKKIKNKRLSKYLYSLGFKRETIYKNGVESWLFDNSKVLQEALDFYFYMRQKNR